MKRARRVVITTVAAASMAGAAGFTVSNAFAGNGIVGGPAVGAIAGVAVGPDSAEVTGLRSELDSLIQQAEALRGVADSSGAAIAPVGTLEVGRKGGEHTGAAGSTRSGTTSSPGVHGSTGASGGSGEGSNKATSPGTGRPASHGSTGSSGSGKPAGTKRPTSPPASHGSTGSSGSTGGGSTGGGTSNGPSGGHEEHEEHEEHDDD